MQEEIMLQIYAYSANSLLFDKEFAEKIINIIVKEKGLEEYITDLEYNELKINGRAMAMYSLMLKKIKIYIQTIFEDIKTDKKIIEQLNTLNQYLLVNAMFTRILIHETVHASDKKLIAKTKRLEDFSKNKNRNSDEKNMKEILLNLTTIGIDAKIAEFLQRIGKDNPKSAKESIEEKDTIYTKYYELSLEERLADNISYQEIIHMLSKHSFVDPISIQYLELFKLKELLRGYKYNWKNFFSSNQKRLEVVAPTIKYLEKNNTTKFLKEYFPSWYSENSTETLKSLQQLYTLEQRLKYGLPITVEEFQNEQDKAEKFARNLKL